MSNLSAQIESDFLTSYKAREEISVSVLRMLKTVIKNRQVELGRELEDGDVLDLVAKQLKQRQESLEQFTSAGRVDLAATEAAEMEVLKRYMPEPLSEDETRTLVDRLVEELGAATMKDMGRVMQAVSADYKGRVDNKLVSQLVRAKLSA